jgi:hypothetical protein
MHYYQDYLITIKHAQAQQLWPQLTSDVMENMQNNEAELTDFIQSMINKEICGQLYVWVNADETKYSLGINPHKDQ